MKTPMNSFIVLIGLMITCGGCIKIQPIAPPPDPPRQPGVGGVCKPPPFEKNIVGMWHFQSTQVTEHSGESGTVTFLADGKVIDPDSLFEATIELGTVLSKTYDPAYIIPHSFAQGEKVFAVIHQTKQGRQIMYYSIVSNECNRIQTRIRNIAENARGFVLTR